MTLPFIISDQVETLNMTEKNGVIVSLDRYAKIGGLGSNLDYGVLLAAYAQVGLPVPGSFLVTPGLAPSTLTAPGALNGAAMLVLAGREFKLVNEDKATVGVLMHYQHFMEGGNQNLGGNATTNNSSLSPNGWYSPFSSAVHGKGRSSVQQTKTNFMWSRLDVPDFDPYGSYQIGTVVNYRGVYWINKQLLEWDENPLNPIAPPPGPGDSVIGDVWDLADESLIVPTLDEPVRRQIVVGHQFPGSGPNKDPNYPGQVKYQTGEITVMQPHDNFKLQGQVFIRNPRTIKKMLVGAINSEPWMDGGRYEWMCTEVTWDPVYVKWQYMMSFEFQHNPDGWLPTAVFHDQRIGRPPAGLVAGFGYKQIHYQRELDMEAYFNATLGCAPSAG